MMLLERFRSPSGRAIRNAGPRDRDVAAGAILSVAVIAIGWLTGILRSVPWPAWMVIPFVILSAVAIADADGWRIRRAMAYVAIEQRKRWTRGRIPATPSSAQRVARRSFECRRQRSRASERPVHDWRRRGGKRRPRSVRAQGRHGGRRLDEDAVRVSSPGDRRRRHGRHPRRDRGACVWRAPLPADRRRLLAGVAGHRSGSALAFGLRAGRTDARAAPGPVACRPLDRAFRSWRHRSPSSWQPPSWSASSADSARDRWRFIGTSATLTTRCPMS